MRCPDCERTAARPRGCVSCRTNWTPGGPTKLRRSRRNRLEGQRASPVRALILLADMRGRVLSLERIAGLGGRDAEDIRDAEGLARNTACHARGSLRPLGLASALETVPNLGYQLAPEAGVKLRTLMGDFEGFAP